MRQVIGRIRRTATKAEIHPPGLNKLSGFRQCVDRIADQISTEQTKAEAIKRHGLVSKAW